MNDLKSQRWLAETELLCSDITVPAVAAFFLAYRNHDPATGTVQDLARSHGLNAGMCEYTIVQLQMSGYGVTMIEQLFAFLADELR